MKIQVLGVKRIEGTAKVSGNPFDMCRLYALVPIDVSSGKVRVTGYGYEVAEMNLDSSALAQFAGLKFPVQLELKIDQNFVFGEFRSVVVGFDANHAIPSLKASQG